MRKYAQGQHSSVPGTLCTYCGFQFSIFSGILECINKCIPDSYVFSRAIFFKKNLFVLYNSYVLVFLIFYYISFYYYPFVKNLENKALSFNLFVVDMGLTWITNNTFLFKGCDDNWTCGFHKGCSAGVKRRKKGTEF